LRRALLWGSGLFLLLAAAGLGFALSGLLAPERVRVEIEERLADWLGPVEVGPVRPSLGWGIALEVRGIRTRAAAAGTPSEPALSAARVRLVFDLRRLLRGEVGVRRVAISGLRVDAARSAQGEWSPAALATLLERWAPAPPEATATGAGIRGPDRLRELAAELPAVSIDGAAVRLRTLRADGLPASELALRGVSLHLDRTPLVHTVHLTAAGRIADAKVDRGGFELVGELPAKSTPHAELALSDVELALLEPWIPRPRAAALELGGHASATLGWRPGAHGEQQLEVEALLRRAELGGRLAADRPPLRFEWPSARLAFALELGAHELRVEKLDWSSANLRLAGAARLGLPFEDTAAATLELHGGPLAWTALRDLLRAAAPPRSALRRIVDAVTAGSLETLALHASRTKWSDWRALAASPLDGWPAGLAVDTNLDGVEIDLGASDPIRDLGAQVSWTQDHLELSDAHARLGTRPLPNLHLALGGLRAVAAALASQRLPDPVPAVPGFRALNDWIDQQKKPGQPPKWRRLELSLDWLDHPALLRPLEGVRAVLTPAEPGFNVEIDEAYWGGAHVKGRGSVHEEGPGRLDFDLVASLPLRSPRKPPTAEPWLRGSWRADLEKLGPFLAARAVGRLQAVGERASLLDVEAAMRPTGWTKGEVALDVSHADAVPYRISLEADDLSLSQLMTDVELDGEAATGRVRLGGTLVGHLVPGAHGTGNLADAAGPVSARLRDGEIRRRLNLMMAIAAASDTLNPFRSRDVIPFRKIEAELQLGGGPARVESFSLTGPAIRMVGTGNVDIVNEPHELQGVVALYFFRTLDKLINAVPMVNKLLLGEDQNLVAAYFAVSGPWGDPHASVIPLKTLLAIPTNIVIEGLPAFARSGITQIERLLSMLPSAGEKSDAPAAPPKPEAHAGEGARPGAIP
jgi:hypothetical protein